MIVCGFLAIGVCWMLYLVLLSPLQPLPGKSIAMSQNNDQHIHAKPDLFLEGLAWPWGSSVAVLGSGSTSIQLSIFCFTAVTGASKPADIFIHLPKQETQEMRVQSLGQEAPLE